MADGIYGDGGGAGWPSGDVDGDGGGGVGQINCDS